MGMVGIGARALLRTFLPLAGLVATSSPASAAVRYVGGFSLGAIFDTGFDVVVPTFLTTSTTLTVGPDVSCSSNLFGSPSTCNSVTFNVPTTPGDSDSASVDIDGNPPFFAPGQYSAGTFPSGSFGRYGSFSDGTGNFLTVSAVGPAAPAPLLGLGLLPAFAAAGGVALTRRRRRGEALA